MEDSLPFSVSLSEDITPPLSPIMQQEVNEVDDPTAKRRKFDLDLDIAWVAPRFDCLGHRRSGVTWSPAGNGFIGTRALARLLEGTFPCTEQEESPVTQLFGFQYVTSTALLDQRSHLFCILRQTIGKMDSLLGKESHWSNTDPLLQSFKRLREQVLDFFTYVHTFIQRFLHPSNRASSLVPSEWSADTPSLYARQVAGFPSQLAAELTNLSQYVGGVSDLPASVLHQYAMSQARQASHDHLPLHFHLDVRWYIVQILHQLHASVTGSVCELEVLSSLNSQVEGLLKDLVAVAVMRHNELSPHEVHQTSLFPCACLQEMWLLLIHLLDHRHVNFSGTSFWGSLHQALSLILEGSSQEDQDRVTARDPMGACWWLLQGLAPLYSYDKIGQEISQPISRSHWFLVEDLVKKMLSKDVDIPEAKFQSYLRHLLGLAQLWEPHPKILASLWDHFYKKLNHRLNVPSQGLQGLASISKSALSWFQVCKGRCDDPGSSQGQDTSFHLFLRILACKMKKWNSAGNLQPWKQLQGRLYSKFHSRTMQELGEIGLQRFFDLFLTLGLLVDLSPLMSRVLDFLDLVPTNLNLNRQLLMWRGLFALCLVHEARQCDLETVADRLATSFNAVAKSYVQIRSDPLRRSDTWRLIACYLEGAQEVLDSSNLLSLTEDKLIARGLEELLSSASEQELRSILMFAQTTMARHRSLYKQVLNQASSGNEKTSNLLMTKYKALANALWSHIYPFVKQHSTTQTPPPHLADVAAGFTLLAADLPHSSEGEMSAWSLFHYFGLNSVKVHASIRTRYLCHLLPNQSFMETLQPPPGAGSIPCLLVRAWFHASTQIQGSSDQMQELGRLVMKLPPIVSMMHSLNAEEEVWDSSRPLVYRFLRLLGRYFAAAQTYQEKLERRSKALLYLGDLVALVRVQVRGQRSLEEMSRMYQVIGLTVKYCSNVLYSQGSSQSQLPGILTELILFPGAFNSKKPIPSNQNSAIRDTLHLFVEGLCQHDVSRDSYIQRKLKEITCQYFLRYKVKLSSPGSGDASSLHPLVRSLIPSFQGHIDPKHSSLRRYILSEFRDRFLTPNPHQVSQHTAPSIIFLQEVMYRTTSMAQIARDTVVLLKTVLDILLLCDSTSVKGQMTQILTRMMNACKADTPGSLRLELVSVLRGFLSQHIHAHRRASFERLESVAILHPTLMARLIPDCTRLVEESEHRRAVGVDSVLRQAYMKVLSHLGPAGQAESQLIRDAMADHL